VDAGDPRLLLHGRARRRLGGARLPVGAARERGAGQARVGRVVRGSCGQPAAVDLGPRGSAALPQHAPDVQGHLADERRVLAARRDSAGRLPLLARVARPAAAVLGLPVSTYTAALIANTSIPVWHEARGRLAFVFAGGAAASAGAVAAAATRVEAAGPARRLAVGGAAAELVGLRVMKRGLGELAEPYHEGEAGRYSKLGAALTIAGAAAVAGAGGRSRLAAMAGGAMLATGALAERFSIFRAGFQSAADPRYVVGPQRARIDRGETRGAARKSAKLGAEPPAA